MSWVASSFAIMCRLPQLWRWADMAQYSRLASEQPARPRAVPRSGHVHALARPSSGRQPGGEQAFCQRQQLRWDVRFIAVAPVAEEDGVTAHRSFDRGAGFADQDFSPGFSGKGMDLAWSFRNACQPRPDMASTFPSTNACRLARHNPISSILTGSWSRAGTISATRNFRMTICTLSGCQQLCISAVNKACSYGKPREYGNLTCFGTGARTLPLAFPGLGEAVFAALGLGPLFRPLFENGFPRLFCLCIYW